jgi:hypothetical protein
VVLEEEPGRLSGNALATRLSFFLWNSEPDAELRAAAARGDLHRPEGLRAQAERLLNDPKAQRFVTAFLNYWIDLRKIEDTTPSNALYNDYYLDDMLTEAAVAESQLFFDELLRRDLPARNIVASDFTFLNENLALHYGITGVKGVAMRRVTLPPDSPRGGFMTQASVLKITANGLPRAPRKMDHGARARLRCARPAGRGPRGRAGHPWRGHDSAATRSAQCGRKLRRLSPEDRPAGLRPRELRCHGGVARPLPRPLG